MENMRDKIIAFLFLLLATVSCNPDNPLFSDDDYIGEFDVFELNEQVATLVETDLVCYIQTSDDSIIKREVLHKKGKSHSKFKMYTGLKDGEYRLLYFEHAVPKGKGSGGHTVQNFGLGMRILIEDGGYQIMDEYNSQYGLSGEGTESDPFIITCAAHLETLRHITNSLPTEGVFFSQMTNILANDMLYYGYQCDPEHYWTPIGYDVNKPFRGIYDGNGYFIQGVKSISSDKTIGRGLFGFLCGATINNLVIKDSYIVGTYGAGVLAGIVVSDAGERDITQVFNCEVNGSEVYGLTGCISLGGVVGAVDSRAVLNIANSKSVGSLIKGDYNVGGLVGAGALESKVVISACTNSSQVTVLNAGAGGIIANGDTLLISASQNLEGGNVSGPKTKANSDASYVAYGGIVGGARCANITACENYSSVTGYEGVGGIIGSTRIKYDDDGFFFNNVLLKYCKNEGNIVGVNNVGGLCGESQFGCYGSLNKGKVSGTDYIGGLAGNTSMAVIENSINKGEVSGSSYVAGIAAKTSTGVVAVSQNYGYISATGSHAAGVVGYSEDYMMVHYCSNYGSVSGNSTPIGGIVAEIGKEQELSPMNKAEIAFGVIQIFVGGVLGPVLGVVEHVTEKIAFMIVEVALDVVMSITEVGFLSHAIHEYLHHEVEELAADIKYLTQESIQQLSEEMETIRKEGSATLPDALATSPITADYPNAIISLANDINNEENNKLFNQNISDDLNERLEEVEELNEEHDLTYLITGGILLVVDVVAIATTIATAGTSAAVLPMVLGVSAACLGGANSIIKGATDYADNVVVISQCTNMGKITGGDGDKIGGIVGLLQQRGAVKNCLNIGDGPGSSRGGQIIGYAEKEYSLETSLTLNEGTWSDIIGDEAVVPYYPLDGVYYFSSGSTKYDAGREMDTSEIDNFSLYEGWNSHYWTVPSVSEKLSYPVPYRSEMFLKE